MVEVIHSLLHPLYVQYERLLDNVVYAMLHFSVVL